MTWFGWFAHQRGEERIRNVCVFVSGSWRSWAKPDTPEANGFATDSDASLSEKIFYIQAAEVEVEAWPDCITDNFVWEPRAIINIDNGTKQVSLMVNIFKQD